MKMKKNDGGAAYLPSGFSTDKGISKREWFAGMAMQGIIENAIVHEENIPALAFKMANAGISHEEGEE